jgi:hypothetical protein
LEQLQRSESEGLLGSLVCQRARLQQLSEMAFEGGNLHAATSIERAITNSLELTSKLLGYTIKQDIEERFDVVHAERLKLGTSYPNIVAHVCEVLTRPPLRDGCDLVIDESGVGRAVGDMFDATGLKPVRVSFTAGTDAARLEGARRWSVAKGLLISGVDARLHSGQLRFAADPGQRMP